METRVESRDPRSGGGDDTHLGWRRNHGSRDLLRFLQEIEDRAKPLDVALEFVHRCRIRRGGEVHGVGDVVGMHGPVLLAGPRGARIEFSLYIDGDRIDRDAEGRGLDQIAVRQAAAEHAELQLGRAGAEVVACKIRRAVRDDLEIANANAADAAASLDRHGRRQVLGAERAAVDLLDPLLQGTALLHEVVLEIAHAPGPD